MTKFSADDLGFESFADDEPAAPPSPGYEALRQLRRDDLFKVGGKGPTFRVVQSYGDTLKTAVKQGTAGRVLYVVQGETHDYQVGVFPTSGGSIDKTGPSIVPIGIVTKVGAVMPNRKRGSKKSGFDVKRIELTSSGKDSFRLEGEDDGRWGFIDVARFPDSTFWNVREIEVQPQGHGIGTAFYEAAAAEAKRRGGRLGSTYRVSSAADAFWEKQWKLGRATRRKETAPPAEDDPASHDVFLLKEGARSLRNNGGVQLPRARESFDRHFNAMAERFPDFGALELHQDEVAGSDNGHGSERQFGYCTTKPPFQIAFAAKIETLPPAYIDGLMAHEFGHAIDHRYGRKHLEGLFGVRLPDSVERRADKIAEQTFGRRVEYGDLDIQCISCGGKKQRPRKLG